MDDWLFPKKCIGYPKAFSVDFNETADFLENIHRLRFDRPVMFPGVIGGTV
jgi:hypothetical protein